VAQFIFDMETAPLKHIVVSLTGAIPPH